VARLAADDNGPLVATGRQSNAIGSNWSHVIDLPPGSTVTLTAVGQPPRKVRVEKATDVDVRVSDSAGREQTIARRNVTEISVRMRRGSVPGAVGGAALGAFVGIGIALDLGFNARCQPSCGGVVAGMGLAAIGLPIAAGVGGFHLFARRAELVIYGASNPAGVAP